MRIRTRQGEYDERLQSLIEKEKKWAEEASHQAKRNWKENEENFRKREQQTFRWEELNEELKAKYKDLIELRDKSDDVSAKDIEAMIDKMEKVSLYTKRSQEAQSYLKELGDRLNALENHKRNIRDYTEAIKDESEKLTQLIALENDNMFKSELEECQKKSQEFYKECNQSLLNITEERSACIEEVENTKLTLNHITVKLTYRGKELSHLQKQVGTALSNTQKRRDDLKQKEGNLLEVLGGATGAITGGTGGVIAGMSTGAAIGSVAGPAGAAIGGLLGATIGMFGGLVVGVEVGARGGRALNNALISEDQLKKVREEIDECETTLTHIEGASEQLTDSISSYEDEIRELARLTAHDIKVM